jgi:hypothetical protein
MRVKPVPLAPKILCIQTKKTHISIHFPVSDATAHVATPLRPDGRSDSKYSLPEEHLKLFLAFIHFPHRKNSTPQPGHDLLHSAVRADGFVLLEGSKTLAECAQLISGGRCDLYRAIPHPR